MGGCTCALCLLLLAVAGILCDQEAAQPMQAPSALEQGTPSDAGLPPQACPAQLERTATVAQGCPCNPTGSFARCTSGYVCAQPWVLQVAAAAAAKRRLLTSSSSAASASVPLAVQQPEANSAAAAPASPTGFVCGACSFGQYCPPGSSLPPADSPDLQLAIDRLQCPAGRYCPTPAEAKPCPAGMWCKAGSMAPLTCNTSELVSSMPMLVVPAEPQTVYQRVYLFGDSWAGNSCPANSTVPNMPCPAGAYCPEPGVNITCPRGFYCNAGALEPNPCPMLASCPEGSAKANLSWGGFIILAGILTSLSSFYAVIMGIIRLNQRRLLRTQEARDRLWKLLSPLVASQQQQQRSPSFRAFKSVRPQLTIEFEQLGLTLHDGTTILQGVTGRFEHSRVVAVMGPSGAGKSTFLNVLMGKAKDYGRTRGRIRVNDREMKLSALQAITGFVPQDDIVHEDLTVRENLAFSARLRLSTSKPLPEQIALVDDVLDVLQLRHVAHQVVGSVEKRGISGGQRKRVNIGWELAAKPSVLFMDEPTSGLDATAAADILTALKRMAQLGMNVVTIIHQPRFSVFRMFDDVLLLGKGGRTVFLGPSHLALPYFESLGFQLPPNENPADFAMDTISGSVPREGAASFQPEELFGLWEGYGLSWVRTQSRLIRAEANGGAQAPELLKIDPEGLRLLEGEFDAVDADGDGGISTAELRQMLLNLHLEPSAKDLVTMEAELSVGRTGLISKEALVAYVRSGGRPAITGTNPAAGARRNDSLYRMYSIENYTLASAMSELAASGLPPGLRSSASLKDIAEATLGSQAQEAPAQPALTAAPPAHGEQHLQRASAASTEGKLATSSAGSEAPVSLHLQDLQGQGRAAAGLQRDSTFKEWLDGPASSAAQEPAEAERKQAGLIALLAGSSLRSTPGAAGQFATLLQRAGVKYTRQCSSKILDVLLLVFAAMVCGGMHGSARDPWNVRGHTALIFMTLGIISCAVSLHVFGRDRVVFWREKASGIRPLSYFAAQTAIHLVDVFLQPAIFLSVYCALVLPAIPWLNLYLIGVLVVWYCSSLGCLLSVLINPANSLVASVAFTMVLSGFLNAVTPNYAGMSPAMKVISGISYNRWAVEAVAIQEFAQAPQYLWPSTKAVMLQSGYCGLDSFVLPVAGSVLQHGGILEELDVRVYCAGYAKYALAIMAAEGLILRLATLVALQYATKGLGHRLDKLLLALSSAGGSCLAWLLPGKQARRTASGGAGV